MSGGVRDYSYSVTKLSNEADLSIESIGQTRSFISRTGFKNGWTS